MDDKAAQVSVLEYPECVRRRKGMYISSMEQQVFELVDNAVDEINSGHGDSIGVSIINGIITVADNGRGIPVTPEPGEKYKGLSQAEVAYTVLHSGGKFGENGGYKTATGGLHGVGASCVAALSEKLVLDIQTDGKLYEIVIEKGIITEHQHIVQEGVEGTGTQVSFSFDKSIWKDEKLNIQKVSKRLKQIAYLNPNCTIYFEVDDKDVEEKPVKISTQYNFKNGLEDYIKDLSKGKNLLTPVISGSSDIEDGKVTFALVYSDLYVENINTFCNNISTPDGGDHFTAFKLALYKALTDYCKNNNIKAEFTSDDAREGIVAIVSLMCKEPEFEGQTKLKIKMPEIRGPVQTAINTVIYKYLDSHPDDAKIILDKINLACKARLAAQKARESTRAQRALVDGSLPTGFADCSEKDPDNCEIFIVEGDSAGGSAKQARDRKTQAVLPVFGKITNVEKKRLSDVVANQKIGYLIKALRCGIGDTFDIKKLKYHRIIITTDADVDGDHMKALYITVVYRYMREIIENGYLYMAVSPLYRVQRGKDDITYVNTDEELQGTDLTKATVQRFKGLGEMNPEQLWDTTMNPETRTLIQISIPDAEAAEEMVSLCMGDQVQPRKEFIMDNAVNAQLDV